ncbi:hypothetical protein HDU97_001840 [Phlyctochytrium planicorne]|nr:hypothetical protein HDU97_001840 [Phlyctochytrium planicorne]
MQIERAAAGLLGIRAYGSHVNGYVKDDEVKMWVARRSATKQTYPSMLDNLVGGGLPHSISPTECAIKECFEEAGLKPDQLKNLQSVSTISYFMDSPDRGLLPNTEFIYDIQVEKDWKPVCQDGEVQNFYLLTLKEEISPPPHPSRSPQLSNTSSRLYKDSIIPVEPNPDEVERMQRQLDKEHLEPPEYGADVDSIGFGGDSVMSKDPHFIDSFDDREHLGNSGNTLNNNSQNMLAADEKLARRIAREQIAMANAPEGMAGREIPKTLHDPEARKNMPTLRSHRPWFLGIMTVIQISTVIGSLILNLQWTGTPIQTNPFNVMIGPTPGILIQMGARFLPCIRNTTLNTGSEPLILCPDGIKSNTTALNAATNQMAPSCTLEQLCGLGGFNGGEPNQWYRLIIPIFLHGGVVHLIVNLLFQVQTGFQLEKDFGWWRTAAIYFIAGIGGFIFGGNFNGLTPSVGCSGALFGLMACLVIDLFQNWKVIRNPWWELAKLLFTVLLSFLIGMLPYIDNFAHIGGFFCGIFAGLIFMPTVHYSKWDGRIKITLLVVSIPVTITIYIFLIRGFYTGQNSCQWCKYLNCIPGMPWCDQKWNQNFGL